MQQKYLSAKRSVLLIASLCCLFTHVSSRKGNEASPFSMYTFKTSTIDEFGLIRPDILKISNECLQTRSFHDKPLSGPLDGAPDDPPEDEMNEPPHDDLSDQPEEFPGGYEEDRWGPPGSVPPHEGKCDAHEDLGYLSKICYFLNDGFCSLCDDGEILMCCESMSADERARNASVETIYVNRLKGSIDSRFQNISAKTIHIEGVQTTIATIEPRAFDGSQSIEVLKITKNKFGHMKRMDRYFGGLFRLRVLLLDDNAITEWDTIGTSNLEELSILPSLEILSLKRNLFETLGENFFEWLRGSPLKYLNLEGCNKIVKIDPGVLLPVSTTLNFLELAKTNIKEMNLENILSSNLTVLKALGLKALGLDKIPKNALQLINGTIEALSLERNNLKCINEKCDAIPHTDVEEYSKQQDVFPFMPMLKELSLAASDINDFPNNTFHNLPNLRQLILAKNVFSQLPNGLFSNLNKLKYLNLKHIIPTKELQADFHGLTSLQILDVSFTKVNVSENMFCNFPNLKELLLENSGVENVQLSASKCLRNLEVLDLSNNFVLCSQFHEVFKESLNMTTLRMTGCDLGGFEQEKLAGLIRRMKSLEVLYIDNNNYADMQSLEYITELPYLRTLDLSHNNLVSWDEIVLDNNTNLRHLFISSNQLASISMGMMKYFLTLDTLDASDNPYLCYCSMSVFTEFAQILTERERDCDISCRIMERKTLHGLFSCLQKCRKDNKYNKRLQETFDIMGVNYKPEDIDLNILGWSDGGYQCLEKSGRKSIKNFEFKSSECFTDTKSGFVEQEEQIIDAWKMTLITVSAVIVIMLGLCYWKWKYIYQFVRTVRSITLLRLLDDDDEKLTKRETTTGLPYSYDVFISYSDPNRQWVLNELVPNFENGSDLRVCLHERDFQVGISILENIISSMDQSRSILLVISQAFLRSHWCQFELHMAQHRLLETRREDLILVLLEEIPTSRRPKMLRYLMLTKTYIQWPGYDADAETLKVFWKRLRHAVMLPRVTSNQDSAA